MESQDLGKASQPAYRAGSPPYKQALRRNAPYISKQSRNKLLNMQENIDFLRRGD